MSPQTQKLVPTTTSSEREADAPFCCLFSVPRRSTMCYQSRQGVKSLFDCRSFASDTFFACLDRYRPPVLPAENIVPHARCRWVLLPFKGNSSVRLPSLHTPLCGYVRVLVLHWVQRRKSTTVDACRVEAVLVRGSNYHIIATDAAVTPYSRILPPLSPCLCAEELYGFPGWHPP